MATQLYDDNFLIIQLLCYDKPTELKERYYFLEMSTLQSTTLLPDEIKIINSEIVACTTDNKYLEDNINNSFTTIGDFNTFFQNNADYYIHNCHIELERGIRISSHDDGEVTIEFLENISNQTIIDNLFKKYNLDNKLIAILKNSPGHYIAIDTQNNVTGDYLSFDDYLKNGRD